MSHATPSLRGQRILVVEDEYLIAMEVARMLADAGAEVLGPTARVEASLQLIGAQADRIDGAVLDINLRGEQIWPVVATLQARGVPVLITTGYDASAIPAAYAHLRRCEKPIIGAELVRAVGRLLAAP